MQIIVWETRFTLKGEMMGLIRSAVKQVVFAAAVVMAKRMVDRLTGRSRRKQLPAH